MVFIESIHEIPNYGFTTVSNILSNQVAVLFSVPDHAWKKLEQSMEWRDFQALVERMQKEPGQKQR